MAGAQPPPAPEDPAVLVDAPAPGPGPSNWEAAVAPTGALGIAGAGPGQAPAPDSSSVAIDGDLTRIHVKFAESARASFVGGEVRLGSGQDALDAALTQVDATVMPLFDRPAAALERDRRAGEAGTGEALPDLRTWFLFTVDTESDGVTLIEALRGSPSVEMVQPEPSLAATAPVEEERQGYLDSGPAGIGAEWSWGRTAGTGSRVTVAVIDSGFDTAHADLDRASAAGVAIPHEPAWDTHHGLQVLGILVGDDDNQGVRGIASGAGIHTINSGTTSGQVANAIDLASAALGAGDVISVSQGICAVEGCADSVVLPLVYSSSARDALRLAAARGIITVVSGGNGGANLDDYSSRLGSDAPDTIVVGAGNPAAGSCSGAESPARGRVAFSNYGSRIDLQGWGACVRTTQQGGGYRWWGFTSAATPVVAGATALVSSIAEQRLGVNLTGAQVRSLLEESGAPQVFAGARGGNIGPLPDTRAAAIALGEIPDNDMWQFARAVPDLPFAVVEQNRLAGVELDEPAVLCGSISHTAWYQLTPTADMTVTIDTMGSDHDTLIGLWRAASETSLARVACDDDISDTDPTSRLTRALERGTTYYIQAGGADGANGRLRVRITSDDVADTGCDVNNNGRGDIVSGSPKENVRGKANAGRALVHFGRHSGKPRKVTSITQEWPEVTGRSERGDKFGAAVACGDFDGDGYDDLAIGSPGEDVNGKNKAGAVRIIPGGPGGVSETGARTITQATAGIAGKVERGDRFGASLAVGDINGDGYLDLAIGSPGESIGGSKKAGGVHVIPGGISGLDPTASQVLKGSDSGVPNRAEPNDELGGTLSFGDFNGDGYADLAVGAAGEEVRGQSAAGAVLVWPGSADGATSIGSLILHQGVDGVPGAVERGDQFGTAMTSADINGDGVADLLVGIPGEAVDGNKAVGTVAQFLGGDQGLSTDGAFTFRLGKDGASGVPGSGDRYGSALVAADIDGDGFGDLAVGAPGATVSGAPGAGFVHVLRGSSAGLATTGDRIISQAVVGINGFPDARDRFGASLGAVDMDGDGLHDLMIGVPAEDVAGTFNSGAIQLVWGSTDGADTGGSRRLTQRAPATGKNQRGDQFGSALAG